MRRLSTKGLLSIWAVAVIWIVTIGFTMNFLPSLAKVAIAFAGTGAFVYFFRKHLFVHFPDREPRFRDLGGFRFSSPDPYARRFFVCASCGFPHKATKCPKCGSRMKKLV